MMQNLKPVLIVARREVRDQFRDWRIIFPIIGLTLLFPILMNFTARQAVRFVENYGAPEIGDRLIPFLLMIVGFFPITVSLVIALDSFVGEKERKSIEPLLASPLEDRQLYLGKLFAALVPPLLAAYLGISVYLIGVYWQVGWAPSPILLTQIVSLTTVQAIVMVSAAVVISTQTTSVRAANLLSSFIIIPMVLLIQGESIIMFWARYPILWWVIAGLLVVSVLLVRTGVVHFHREELLGRELDSINFKWFGTLFIRAFIGGKHNLMDWYRDVFSYVRRELSLPMLIVGLLLVFGLYIGSVVAGSFPLPPEIIDWESLGQGFVEGLDIIRLFSVVVYCNENAQLFTHYPQKDKAVSSGGLNQRPSRESGSSHVRRIVGSHLFRFIPACRGCTRWTPIPCHDRPEIIWPRTLFHSIVFLGTQGARLLLRL